MYRIPNYISRWIFLAGTLMCFAACGNDSGGPVLSGGTDTCPQANFSSIYLLLGSQQCAQCHSNDSPAGQMSFVGTEEEVYERLVNAATNNATAVNSFPTRVAPGDADNSYLFRIIADEAPLGSSSGRMPPGGALADCEIDAINEWITTGAAAQ